MLSVIDNIELSLNGKVKLYGPEKCVTGYTEICYNIWSEAKVYISDKNKKPSYSFGQYTTIYQPEIYAILRTQPGRLMND